MMIVTLCLDDGLVTDGYCGNVKLAPKRGLEGRGVTDITMTGDPVGGCGLAGCC